MCGSAREEPPKTRNFGIATSFEFRLHPIGPMVTGGLIAYPFSEARDVLRFYRDTTNLLSDEHIVFAGLTHAPDGSGAKLVVIITCHCGSPAEGEAAMRPLKQFGSPVLDALGPLTYCQLNTMLDAGNPKGALNYWKSSFLAQLTDDAIDTMIESFASCPAPMGGLLLEHFHGAATRVGATETAFPHRADGYNLLVLAQWMEAAASDKCVAWARETYAAMEPSFANGRYANYLDDDEAGDSVVAAYGPNYRRLQEIKTKYDPTNFFHINQNIRPSF